MKTLPEVLDMDLEDLTRLHLRREDRSTLLGFYASALRHYLEGDVASLKAAMARLDAVQASVEEKKILRLLFKARVEIRSRAVKEDTLTALELAVRTAGDWRGELHFVAALAYEAHERTKEASLAYQKAVTELEDIGAKKKAVKAMLNHVAAENLLQPKKRFLTQYQHVYALAKKAKNHSTAGMALLNIADDYHELGAHRLSLSHINRALAHLERQKQGRSYFLALAQRALVLHDLGRDEEGRLDFEALLASPFADLEGVRQTLDEIYAARTAAPDKEMPAPWRGKSLELKTLREKLGDMEQRLLQFVASEPREKMDIILHLYGDKLSPEVLERRFHNTLARIKKKCPGLIVFEKGRYRLSPEIFAILNR